ncbi:MAG TPA: BTAD domain-containing putative transcriptional regulator [Longimicrobium sp.]
MKPPDFRLSLLGDPAFSGPRGPVQGRAAHKRRVALLAVLAVARGRPVARERLIGLLWPELTTEASRHNLSESLYVLRKELGDEALVSASAGDVALDPAVVASDVAEFQAALETGDAEAAVRAYGGRLLDGFYVADAPEFERWAEGERDRLARLYAKAVEGLAEAAEAEGSAIRAVDWWRRLAAHDPFSSRTALRLVRALDAAGERPSALRAAEAHATLLREELGVDPDPDLLAFVARLRAEPAREASPPSPLPRPPIPGPGEPPFAAQPFDPLPLDPVPTKKSGDGGEVADAPSSPIPQDREDVAREMEKRGDGRRGAGGRVRAGAAYYAGMAGVVLGMALSVLGVRAAERRAREAAAAYDPRRIAVLYFDDLSPRGELQYLAAGLTEMLIHELGQVRALDVVSRGGVKAYRGGAVRFDSMVAELRVGSVVEGTIQRSGDSVWVTVDLVDANTRGHLESRVLGRPLGDVVALERAVAEEVSASLRRRLGEEVRLREAAGETRSAVALERVLQAEQLRRDAREMEDARDTLDAGSVARLLARADSLLAAAETADPRWARAALLRGWVGADRAAVAGIPSASGDSLLRDAAGRAARVLARAPGDAGALELRGLAVYRLALAAGDTLRQRAQLDAAERDLRAAVARDPSLASAWATLSQLLRVRGRLAESDLAARRALAEDAYLDDAADIRHRLFFSTLRMGDYPQARAECDGGRRQFPTDWRFVECALTLLGSDRARPADPAAAWRLVAELDRMDPPGRARSLGRAYSPVYRRMVAAAVLARAGAADSARAIVARARREAGADPELGASLDYDEAYVRLLLADTAGARLLLERVAAYRPALRPYLARDPLFRGVMTAAPASATATPGPARARPGPSRPSP